MDEKGFQNAAVTIDTIDWFVSERLENRISENPDADLSGYRDYYVDSVLLLANLKHDLARQLGFDALPHSLLVHHNALYADYDGQVFDPTKQGLDDLKSRRFRFVGDADARVKEDYLRILRFFRFLAWYGRSQDGTLSKPDAISLKACRENAKGLKKLSAERVWMEIKKLLLAPDPSRALRIMLTNDILETVLPEASNVEGLERLIALERREAIEPDPLLRLMALSTREPLPMALLTKRLKMSNAEKSRLVLWATDSTSLDPHADDRAKRIAIYKAGKSVILDRARLRAAGAEDAITSARWMSLADLAMGWTPPDFPLTGKDLIKAGEKPGEAMGKKLAALKALWVRSGFSVEKEKLLMALKLLG